MIGRPVPHLHYVVGPDGSPLTLTDLPSPKVTRWSARRKAEIVAAVCGGLLNLADAHMRYGLSIDEFLMWYRQTSRHGLAGLRTTKIQEYRKR